MKSGQQLASARVSSIHSQAVMFMRPDLEQRITDIIGSAINTR